MLAGIVGLELGYYALLWLRGPSIDFLNVAKYVPPALLPPSFESNQPASVTLNTSPQSVTPPQTTPESATAEDAEDDTSPAETAPPEALATDEQSTPSEPETTEIGAPVSETESPAEVQAGFTEEQAAEATAAPPAIDAGSVGDRYTDTSTSANISATEPAEFSNQPSAASITESQAIEDVRIDGAPSFTASDLSAALDAAKDAQPKLVEGNFADGKEVARAKGLSYAALADLAQKATLVDAVAESAEASPLQQASEDLFRQTLAEARIRDEVGVILLKWIASPNRKHGGVFFAGNVASQQPAGSVVECRVDLENGQSITVLAPPAAAEAGPDDAQPQAVIGYIIDQPAERIEGYTGAATQAVWTNRLIPLE
jgi:hypothetical protein